MNRWRGVLLVARREAVERVRSRAFLVSTIITLLVIIGLVVFTRISATRVQTFDVVVTGEQPFSFESVLAETAAGANARISVNPSPTTDAARVAVADGTAHAAVIGTDTIVIDRPGGGVLVSILEASLQQSRFLERLDATGLDPEVIRELLAVAPITVEALEPPPAEGGEAVGVAAVVLIFAVITMYGQWVLMGVLEEKTTNVVEQILPSVNVQSLLAGKVLGIGSLGLAQLALLVVGGLGVLTAVGWVDIPPSAYPAAAWAFVWFVLGFTFYAVLFAAAGSLVSRTEDAQAASTPIMLVGVASYLVSFALVPNPDSVLTRIVSLLPPVAPIAFPARVGFSGVPVWEMALGVAVMLLAIVGVAKLAARIYAGALLAGGGKVKIRQAWRDSRELASG